MANTNLRKADKNKNDEFYTQYTDIQNEINAYIAFDENIFRDKIILLGKRPSAGIRLTQFLCISCKMFTLQKVSV